MKLVYSDLTLHQIVEDIEIILLIVSEQKIFPHFHQGCPNLFADHFHHPVEIPGRY